jgi:hypothetical protein
VIDERSLDGTGFAQFGDCRRFRYRLQRELTPGAFSRPYEESHAVVFVMLNPSTADAFNVDPTVRRCINFARRFGGDVLEVVNLFALRSPCPKDLYAAAKRAEPIGADLTNDDAISKACEDWGAATVFAAWGNHGALQDRGEAIIDLLQHLGKQVNALRVTESGLPMHPLARGKHYIPDDVAPVQIA